MTEAKVADDLDGIYPISLWTADFTLLACAKVRNEEDTATTRMRR